MTMPYAGESITDVEKIASFFKRQHAVVKAEIVAATVEIAVEHSSFSDPGDDWSKYECKDKDGNVLLTLREDGY